LNNVSNQPAGRGAGRDPDRLVRIVADVDLMLGKASDFLIRSIEAFSDSDMLNIVILLMVRSNDSHAGQLNTAS
jgi:hypothetical protein